MDKDTQAARPHIDTLRVVYGHAFVITPIDAHMLPGSGKHRDHRDEVSPWLYLPAGRGE